MEDGDGSESISTFRTREDVLEAIEDYKKDTCSGWRCVKKESAFDNPTTVVLEAAKGNARVMWSNSVKAGISTEFDGTPFLSAGKVYFDCHQGVDTDVRQKEKNKEKVDEEQQRDHAFLKRRTLIQPSKKVGCPSKLYLARILKFPEYKVQPGKDGKRPERSMRTMSSSLRSNLECSNPVEVQEIFILKVPHKDSHQYHSAAGEAANLREPIDQGVITKIEELHQAGVTSVAEVRRHIKSFIQKEVFRGQLAPSPSRRRYYPSSRDIRNILNAKRAGKKRSPDDQEDLSMKCEEWQQEYPSDSIYLRKSSESQKFLFVYQSEWMKRLLLLYGQDMCLLDATYRVCRYAIPLFFLCVRTNVCYIVVAVFITENEDTHFLVEALNAIATFNPSWSPANFMVDFSLAEINALQICFPNAHIHLCDFHREKAWHEWLSKHCHGVSTVKDEILQHLRKIAASTDEEEFDKHTKQFKESTVWQQAERLQEYYTRHWEKHKEKWVRCYRSESLNLAVYTNNGIERQNGWLKSTYLENKRNSSISELAEVLITQFLPDSYQKYKELNFKASSSYRKYDERVPFHLRNRPTSIIQHLIQRLEAGHSPNLLTQTGPLEFKATSSNGKETYDLKLGSGTTFPMCQCHDFVRHKLPCKHLCAVTQLPSFNWEALGNAFWEYPLFNLDAVIVQPPIMPKDNNMPSLCETVAQNRPTEEDLQPMDLAESECDGDNNIVTAEESLSPVSLPPKTSYRPKTREAAVKAVKSLMDELYIISDEAVLLCVQDMVQDVLRYTRGHHPLQNGLPLKDKRISPQKRKSTAVTRPLKLRKSRRKVAKRFGVAAEKKTSCQQTTTGLEFLSANTERRPKCQSKKATNPRKRLLKADSEKHTKTEQRSSDNNDLPAPFGEERIAVTSCPISPATSTPLPPLFEVCADNALHQDDMMLLSPGRWLNDNIINAVQRLLKQQFPNMSGLQDTLLQQTGRLRPESMDFVQIVHNKNHWIVFSTLGLGQSYPGVIRMYDSMRGFAVGTDIQCIIASLLTKRCTDVTIKIENVQQQTDLSSCGLFAAAFATHECFGLKLPGTVFDVEKMRPHLHNCLVSQHMEPFPVLSSEEKSTHISRLYSFALTCVCRMPFTGNMLTCYLCGDNYHSNCINFPPGADMPSSWYCPDCKEVTTLDADIVQIGVL